MESCPFHEVGFERLLRELLWKLWISTLYHPTIPPASQLLLLHPEYRFFGQRTAELILQLLHHTPPLHCPSR
jgi:hypothetical protein